MIKNINIADDKNRKYAADKNHFHSFFDLAEYVRSQKMCTEPGCSTCGCMEFRNFCTDEIGFDQMCELIGAVTPEQILKQNPETWYEPLRIILEVVFSDLTNDAPLMKEYYSIREILLSNIQRHKDEAAARVMAEKEKAAQRRAEKERKAAEHRERSRVKNEEYRRNHLNQSENK